MKFIHTFWTSTKSLKGLNGGWLNEKLHLTSWTLSFLLLKKYHPTIPIKLMTDDFGKKLLVEELHLPYDEVDTSLETLATGVSPKIWIYQKLWSYAQHNEPFVNVDGDFFLFAPIPETILKSEIIAQNLEIGFEFYRVALQNLPLISDSLPHLLEVLILPNQDFPAMNAGIIGGRDYGFFQDYFHIISSVLKSESPIRDEPIDSNFNMFFEQYLMYSFAQNKSKQCMFLTEPASTSIYEGFANFHEVPFKRGFLHFLGNFKKNVWACNQLSDYVLIHFPEYADRIGQLFRKNNLLETIPITNHSFLENSNRLHPFYRTEWLLKTQGVLAENDITEGIKNSSLSEKKIAILEDVYQFEKQKNLFLQQLPSDEEIIENQIINFKKNEKILSANPNLSGIKISWNSSTKVIESSWNWTEQNFFHEEPKMYEQNFEVPEGLFQVFLYLDTLFLQIYEYQLDEIAIVIKEILDEKAMVSIEELTEESYQYLSQLGDYEIVKDCIITRIYFWTKSGFIDLE
jgi:hypothetical protein